ncbi:uncharacterized protein LOC129600510 [Paramacrobiotus metropolitanus]|uniref:uncharacterized protein LOC129600510 n=1 Tax=Paramacrobiotus metropolitanus TaxID=2943436 RepID=UPI002445FA3C|nr:uncharacterized protein LOC129600510 [Paramacrobiotus metropolitanus]
MEMKFYKSERGRLICAEQDDKKRQPEPLDFEAQVALEIENIRQSESQMYYLKIGFILYPDAPVRREASERLRKECGLPSLFNPPETSRERHQRMLEHNKRVMEEELCCVDCENNGPGSCGRILYTLDDDEPVPNIWGSGNLEDWKEPDLDVDDWWAEHKLNFKDPMEFLPVDMLWVDEDFGSDQKPKKKRKHIVVQRHPLRGIPHNYWK